MKIFITGCARSGSTLLARMMNAFIGVYVMKEEVSLEAFLGYRNPYPVLVGKRSEWTIFSQVESNEIRKQLQLLATNNIYIINIVRDGRAVVKSFHKAWGVYNPFIWMDAINQSKKYSDYIDLQIKYEDLIADPENIQAQISEKFNLKAGVSFLQYPEYVPNDCFLSDKDEYLQRPIEMRPINKEFYLKRPNDIEHFNELLYELGYI